MNSYQLDVEVSRQTGEALSKIAPLGFVPRGRRPDEREPLTIDWDERDAERNFTLFPRRTRTPAVL